MTRIADAGLLIAALDRRDAHHAWAARFMTNEPPPWLVCEAVLAEVSASVGSAEPLLEMLQVGDLELRFQMEEHVAELLALVKKYRDQGMDMGDACVVRMSEIFDDCIVYTVDRQDFSVYRRHGRQAVPCVFPG